MGIEQFGSYINKRFSHCISKNKPKNIKNLFIDANGIFYDAVHNRLSENESYVELVGHIINILVDIIDEYNPSDNLIIAIDGLANVAKMNQQKSRRYTKKKDENTFDTRAFTPGTMLMMKIDEGIRIYIKTIKNIKKIIYSSHMVHGEGEHKIFDLIRDNKILENDGNTILHGADGDLLVISLLSKFKNINVYRPDAGREGKKRIGLYYDIKELKKLVKNRMPRKVDDDQIIYQDFAILTYFIGNDFLPRFPNLPNTDKTMELLIKIYNKINKNLTNMNGDIIWYNFYNLLNCMDKWKLYGDNMYEHIYKVPFKYPLKILHDNVTLKNIKGEVINDIYDPSMHYIFFDLNNFAIGWYNKEFEPKDKVLKEKYDGDIYFEEIDIKNMVEKYLQTFQWVIKYYLLGPEKVPNSFFYPFRYTPLSLSVINHLKYLNDKKKILSVINNAMDKKNYNFNVVHQLMMVLPPQSIYLIPKEFHDIYINSLSSVSPVNFQDSIPESTDVDHNTKPNIPPVNPLLTINSMANCKFKKIYKKSMNVTIINYDI